MERKKQKNSKEKPHKKIENKLNKKSQYKDKKYGFGGKKKRSKYNTAESSADYSDLKRQNFNKKKFINKNKSNKKFVNKNKPNKKSFKKNKK